MSIESFIINRREQLNIRLKLSHNSFNVVKSHLQSLINTHKRLLIEAKDYDSLAKFTRQTPSERLENIDVAIANERLSEIKSKSTRSAAKTIFSLYLGLRCRLERAIIDENGERVEGNSFVKCWLTSELAPTLFENFENILEPATAGTVLAYCLQLGTAMRMSSIRQLTCFEIDELLAGKKIKVFIRKTTHTSIKSCLLAFLSTDVEKSMLVVNGRPIIELAKKARNLITCLPSSKPCVNPQKHIFKECIPRQDHVFGIKNEDVNFTYGAGPHEIRRFSISWVRVALVDHPQRDQIVAKFADHTAPGKNSTTARYIQNAVIDSGLFPN